MKAPDGWTILAWMTGALLTGVMHVVHSRPLGIAWSFGLAAGAFEGWLGQAMTRRGLRMPMPRGMAWSLGGGVARMVVLLISWRVGVQAGWPERDSALCLVTMYLCVMVAGVAAISRSTTDAMRDP